MPSHQPSWVRPVYLHVVALFGVALMAFGAIGVVMGVVHIASPDLKQQSDPISRLADAAVGVFGAAIPFEELGAEGVEAFDAVDEELRRQARKAAANDLARSAVVALVGALLYRVHDRMISASGGGTTFGFTTAAPPPVQPSPFAPTPPPATPPASPPPAAPAAPPAAPAPPAGLTTGPIVPAEEPAKPARRPRKTT